MGGIKSDHFRHFCMHCDSAYRILRRHANVILNLFSLMLDAGIHNISEERDKAVFKVEERLKLDLSDEASSMHIFGVIETSMNFLSMNVGIVMDVLHELRQNLSWESSRKLSPPFVENKGFCRLSDHCRLNPMTELSKHLSRTEIDIDDNMMIMSISPSAVPSCTELILGDRVLKINGAPVRTKAEAIAALKASAGSEARIELLRRQFTSPLTAERARKIGLSRLEGFTYFLLSCSKDDSDPVSSFGFTLKLLKNRAHVIALDPKGVASNFFCLGDALLDLDGTPIPFNDLEFVRGYTQKFNKFVQKSRFFVIGTPINSYSSELKLHTHCS
ncbi:hypothetical protein KIN20_026970 [Parelaphostrongylus tenuis]|uniref:PI3K/PI4K catalytic domain-containing protein n=1 Tax=Parelaphostrongylus tenuis TaxID=148309 RepID=A0AAD5QYR2_PARTN|nr:hypothetical protein KIN20_026970 [Parelaphostrongylus tenuis]